MQMEAQFGHPVLGTFDAGQPPGMPTGESGGRSAS